jgi:hypothetical protein
MKKLILVAVLLILPVTAFSDTYRVSVLLWDLGCEPWQIMIRERIEEKLCREYINEKIEGFVVKDVPLKKRSVLHVWGKSAGNEGCDYNIEIERLVENERYTIFGVSGNGPTFNMQILIEGGTN